ncbi:hypothetical protein MKW92_014502 [Papaver armeniacum]|nr:hypothetical protein MKW92_014502 [Papaver armeniacum]
MVKDCRLPLAEKQARKIKFSLDRSTPSLIRIMKRSHVSGCFWLGIPKRFSTSFMSKDKISMTLVDHKGKMYNVTYIGYRTALSGGWKGFAEDHNLRMGDAVLFQLVNLETFKVFIVRENGVADTDGRADTDGTEDNDGDISLLELKAQAQESIQGNAGKNLKRERKPVAKHQRVGDTEGKPAEAKRQRHFPSAVVQDANRSQQQPDVVDSVVGDFESFTKIVSDLVGDSEMPGDVMAKYYKLCCTHNSFLHTNLHPGHNHDLVACVITETVKIVYGIRSCKLRDTFNGELTVWRNKLEAFEKLGMSVGFIFPRLSQLEKLSENAARRFPYQQIYQE